MNYFDSYDEKFCKWNPEDDLQRDLDLQLSLGKLAKMCGQRPSDLLDWNNPGEWYQRLMFDFKISSIYAEHIESKK